jgi:hypothetical protein
MIATRQYTGTLIPCSDTGLPWLEDFVAALYLLLELPYGHAVCTLFCFLFIGVLG